MGLSPAVRPLHTLAVGIGQIFFTPHWIAGVLITAGVAAYNPVAAVFLVLGCVVQTCASWALETDAGDRREGLAGFNGALVGVAAWSLAGTSASAVLLTALGACAAAALYAAVGRLFSLPALRASGLPVSTAPFCITASAMFLMLPDREPAVAPTFVEGPLAGLGLGVLNGFAEVVLADGPLAGALILAGVALAAPRAAGFGALGAVVATATAAIFMGAGEASTGLYTYPAILTAMALGAIFWTNRPGSARAGAAVAGAVLSVALTWAMGQLGGPIYTWPFLLAMWAIMLAFPAKRGEA